MSTQLEAVQTRITWVGTQTITTITDLGKFVRFLGATIRELFRPPFRGRQILQQMEFVGNQSLSIIALSAFFVGAVFSLQIGVLFKFFKAEALMGAVTGKALARELAPMLTGFLLSGRAGSAITAEIATMKVNEQVDAMEAMAVEPINYLVKPRLIALVVMAPILSGLFAFLGQAGAFSVAVVLFDVDQGAFFTKINAMVKIKDLWAGLEKAFLFGIVVGVMSCRYGLTASGGAKGVGRATTNSVVMTLLLLLVVDFIVTYFQVS
jgi:phospholipid/cholesterol/gamma-HCH transport system permease protein